MSKYFSKEEVNTGRQTEFDIARAFSIVGMIITHCYECAGFELNSGFGYIVTTLMGGFLGAPLFMFYMGAATRYSKRSTPKGIAIRGLIIFGFGYILNIFRRIIPAWILAVNWKGVYPFDYNVLMFVEADILQFAGLALLTIALVKKLNIKDWAFIAFSVLTIIIGMLTAGFDTGSEIGNSLLGVLIGTKLDGISGGYFSYCHYLIFVASGYVSGKYWKRVTDKKGFFKKVSPIAAVVTVLAFAAEIHFGFGTAGSGTLENYYYVTIYDALICLVGGLFMAGVYYWLDGVTGKKFHRFCLVMSYNIDIIYFFHLILATWTIHMLLQGLLDVEMTSWMIVLASAIITVASYYFAKYMRDPEKEFTQSWTKNI